MLSYIKQRIFLIRVIFIIYVSDNAFLGTRLIWFTTHFFTPIAILVNHLHAVKTQIHDDINSYHSRETNTNKRMFNAPTLT